VHLLRASYASATLGIQSWFNPHSPCIARDMPIALPAWCLWHAAGMTPAWCRQF